MTLASLVVRHEGIGHGFYDVMLLEEYKEDVEIEGILPSVPKENQGAAVELHRSKGIQTSIETEGINWSRPQQLGSLCALMSMYNEWQATSQGPSESLTATLPLDSLPYRSTAQKLQQGSGKSIAKTNNPQTTWYTQPATCTPQATTSKQSSRKLAYIYFCRRLLGLCYKHSLFPRLSWQETHAEPGESHRSMCNRHRITGVKLHMLCQSSITESKSTSLLTAVFFRECLGKNARNNPSRSCGNGKWPLDPFMIEALPEKELKFLVHPKP